MNLVIKPVAGGCNNYLNEGFWSKSKKVGWLH